jgi:hypothetical protein
MILQESSLFNIFRIHFRFESDKIDIKYSIRPLLTNKKIKKILVYLKPI